MDNIYCNLDIVLDFCDFKVRLDSLALICENPKTTEPILEIEFDLIKHFLYFNSDSPSPSYRQCVVSSFKKVYFFSLLLK